MTGDAYASNAAWAKAPECRADLNLVYSFRSCHECDRDAPGNNIEGGPRHRDPAINWKHVHRRRHDDLEWLLRDLLSQGERKLIFDLVGVDLIDADAALFLVRCFFATRGFGGELRFAGASAHVARPFRTTMLDTLLPFDPTVTAACAHFKGRSAGAGG